MSLNGRAVAITAVGVVCGLGVGRGPVTEALRAGRRALAPLPNAHPAWPRWPVVAVPDGVHDLEDFPDDRKVALLDAALREALVGAPDVAPGRRGVFLGTGLSSVTPRELEEEVFPHVRGGHIDRDAAMRCLDSGVAPRRHLPERALGHVARCVGAEGPCATTFSACAAGAEAIASGFRAVARGDADVVFAGGHDSMLHPLGLLSFHALGALASEQARPFDRRRDGFVLGEGAAVLRLEPLHRAARPLAVIRGAGTSMDAYRVTAPEPDGRGAEAAMRRALADARVSPSDVDWVNAHATATPVGDDAEARAIARVLGPHVAVSSLKGAIGHTLAAAGAVEAALTVLAFAADLVPGTVGCEEPDRLGIRVLTENRPGRPRLVLSNSFGFGGQNCSLVLECAS